MGPHPGPHHDLREERNARDLAVIQGLRSGDLDADDAWRELIARHRDRLFSIAYRFTGDYSDAEELAHEITIRVYRQLHRFDPRSHFAGWLVSVARNYCIDRYRMRTREKRWLGVSEVALETFLANPRFSPERLYERCEMRENLQGALKLLSPKLREVVELRFFEDLPYEDIGARLRIPEGTVKSRIHRGREELKRHLATMRQQMAASSGRTQS